MPLGQVRRRYGRGPLAPISGSDDFRETSPDLAPPRSYQCVFERFLPPVWPCSRRWLSAMTLRQDSRSHATAPVAEATSIELPMELLASRPLIRVKINGQGPFGFLLDPEATHNVIDASWSRP